jgi:prevent-host-death family protein
MQTVGVRELKARLSECLRRVRAGERLTVTDRGRAIATLAPVARTPTLDWAHVMVAEGRARWSGGKPFGLRVRVRSRGMPASRMVIEDRR